MNQDVQAMEAARRFSPAERRRLLLVPGIGPTVVRRLEESGICSLDALRKTGVGAVVARIGSRQRSRAILNRVRSLQRACALPGDD